MTAIRTSSAARSAAFALLAAAFYTVGAGAQSPPKRIELADTTRATPPKPTPGISVRIIPPADPRISAAKSNAAPPRPTGSDPRRGSGMIRDAFVRDQTILGLAVYGPSFATAVTGDPVSWAAAYLVVGGGSYFAASELSRNMTISEPTAWLATQTALRGGLAGWALTYAGDASRQHQAAGIFFGSIAGTAAAVSLGQGMTDGEVAASTFGSDLSALTGLAFSHMADPTADGRARVGMTALAGLVGYPLGYMYAHTTSYHVTPGDVTTLWTSTAIGAVAASSLIANGGVDGRTEAATLALGGIMGAVIGDRLLVRRYDHTPEEGAIVALWAAGGGLMGAGVGVLTDATHDRMSGATAAMMAIGAVGGVYFAERYLGTRPDQPNRNRSALRRITVDAGGALAAASGVAGTHPILRWTF